MGIHHIFIDVVSWELGGGGGVCSGGPLFGHLAGVDIGQPLPIEEDRFYELGIKGVEEGG